MAKFEKGHKLAKGRKKGVPNKNTQELKEMILNALAKAGGEDYLLKQSKLNPGAFMQLVSKVLPRDINATIQGSLTINLVNEFE